LQEIFEENTVKFDLKEASNREELLSVLARVIERAYRSYTNRYTKNSEKISWGRLIANCVKAAGLLLRDKEVEELMVKISEIEKRMGVKI
jgi:hypothetical protein